MIALEDSLTKCIKRYCGQQVDSKLTSQVVLRDHLDISNLSTSPFINIRRPKAHQYVNEEYCVDDVVEEFKPKFLETLWMETDI